jgi:GT2 family glycosyltransferase
VSVVIVNFNGEAYLRPCLRSVFAQPYRPIEVVVVDNGSTDGSRRLVAEEFPEAALVPLRTNEGFAGGSNRGVEHARGEFILLLNNDTVVEESWIPGLLESCRVPGRGAVTSRVVTEGVPEAHYARNGSINYLGYNIMGVFPDLDQVFFAGGASVMFRRDVAPHPFPDLYFLYMEDVYLSWRLRLRGLTIAMAQGSVVHHLGSASARHTPSPAVTYYQERNRLLNCLLFYEGWTLVRLLPYLAAEGVSKLLLSVLGLYKSPAGILRAYWWIVAHGAWLRRERRAMQSERSVKDREILRWMSCDVATGGSRWARAANRLSAFYADLVGLPHV